MGMFDWIRVKMPLPGGPEGDVNFQSKTTEDQFLTQYTITENGHLLKENIVGYEDRSDPNATGVFRVVGMATPIIEGTVRVPFHGIIHFHYYDSQTGEYWNYQAKFTDGVCVEIKLLEHTIS